ncbi:MAG TPA: hypothetical protein DDY91_18630 [Planctomycetaceae bacterium]|nr:hypothetical protein [Planctomycetaceae bacterium]
MPDAQFVLADDHRGDWAEIKKNAPPGLSVRQGAKYRNHLRVGLSQVVQQGQIAPATQIVRESRW